MHSSRKGGSLNLKIEVAIPCYNEDVTIEKVVSEFRAVLPEAEIVVYDNNSEDRTAILAEKAGAKVIRINRQGKGYVVQAIFESSKADIVVMVDGDDTYEAGDVHLLIEPIIAQDADMTIGTRLHSNPSEFRGIHHLGNRILTSLLNVLFNSKFEDILSGYRAFSRKFIDDIPIISCGFEIESELMIQALEHGMTVKEIPIGFRRRPPGSTSKLSSLRDGYRILLTMIILLRDHKPMLSFSFAGLTVLLVGVLLWLLGYFHVLTGETARLYRGLGVVLMEVAFGLFLVGLVLNTINTRMRELMSLFRRK
jgi:glycosyltransferase involved in cell wall biosynthesis